MAQDTDRSKTVPPSPAHTALNPSLSVWRFPDFRMLLTGRFLIGMANNMQVVAIGWQIWSLTNSALALGMVGLCGFLPYFAAALFAGHLIDRFERQRILTLCYIAHAVAGAGLLLIVIMASPAWQLYLIYPAVGLNALARAFIMPSYQALTPNLVPRESLAKAIALASSVMHVTVACGPALGGVILALGDVMIRPFFYGIMSNQSALGFGNMIVFLVAALMQVAAVWTAAAIKTRSRGNLNRGLTWPLLFSGIYFIRVRRVLLSAIALDLFAVLLGGATALMPIYADQILQVGPLGLGVMRSAPAIGSLAVGLYLARRPLGNRAGLIMLWAVAGFGAATIVFGLSETLWLSLLALVIMGGTDIISVYVRQNMIQLGTPDDMRGRVGAVSGIFVSTSNEIGEFESGVAAHAFGVVPSVVIGGIGTILCAAIWRLYFRELADVNLTRDGQEKLVQDGIAASALVQEKMAKAY
ncbi:MAG: MFS transporter [Candidatus Symbiobacter sp.]|nr:MFS transporter [Candidatus Symbiobacter sp.]